MRIRRRTERRFAARAAVNADRAALADSHLIRCGQLHDEIVRVLPLMMGTPRAVSPVANSSG
jgi:hypothetical protein